MWYHSGKPPVAIRWVLVRDPECQFKPQAFLCTDPQAEPKAILGWFVQRWQVEVTFEEVRAHLGVETQRQWSERAIARTTPTLFALFSIVTLMAHRLHTHHGLGTRISAWYHKSQPTFSDALGQVRQHLWRTWVFSISVQTTETVKIPTTVFDHLTEALCYAA